MDPTPRQRRQFLPLLGWTIVAPLAFSWGLGVVHPALDVLSIPAGFLASMPSDGGWIGSSIVVLFSIFGLVRPTLLPLSAGAALWDFSRWELELPVGEEPSSCSASGLKSEIVSSRD